MNGLRDIQPLGQGNFGRTYTAICDDCKNNIVVVKEMNIFNLYEEEEEEESRFIDPSDGPSLSCAKAEINSSIRASELGISPHVYRAFINNNVMTIVMDYIPYSLSDFSEHMSDILFGGLYSDLYLLESLVKVCEYIIRLKQQAREIDNILQLNLDLEAGDIREENIMYDCNDLYIIDWGACRPLPYRTGEVYSTVAQAVSQFWPVFAQRLESSVLYGRLVRLARHQYRTILYTLQNDAILEYVANNGIQGEALDIIRCTFNSFSAVQLSDVLTY